MNLRPFVWAISAFLFAFGNPAVWAQDDRVDDTQKEDAEKKEEPKKLELPPEARKKAEVTVNGEVLRYEVTAGMIALPAKNKPEEDRAKVFHVAYVVEQPEGAPQRPITFCFNGGPGSSSVWLHLGGIGPRRVQLDEAGTGTTLAPPPYRVIDNEHTLLDKTDLVFVDPVSTGFSRPADHEKKGDFHGYDEDIESVGAFVHQYCSKHGRWDSPKYLLGESYGGLRSAGLSRHLQDRYGMYLNGVVLVSAVLDFGTILFDRGNDLACQLFLPSYAATARYFEKIEGESPAAVYQKAHKFAYGDYANALHAGGTLSDEKRDAIAIQLEKFTGIDAAELKRANLRPDAWFFRKMLMRDEGKSVGRFDSRCVGIDPNKERITPDYDVSYSVVRGPFSSGMNYYLREEIGFESEEVYEILTGSVHPWNYDKFTNRFVHAGPDLTDAMTENPHLRVFVAAGYYDLATPPASIKHSINHLTIDPSLRKNIAFEFYEGGHMMYTNLASLEKLKADLAKFLAEG